MVNETLNFIDVMQTVTPRDSFYHSKEERIIDAMQVHQSILKKDEVFYSLCLFYPGINDFNKLMILRNLLRKKQGGTKLPVPFPASSQLPIKELDIYRSFSDILKEMGYPRVLRFFLQLREERVNNKRTQKMILSFILSDNKLLDRSLRYRNKMKLALEHAYGKKVTSTLLVFAKTYLTLTDKDKNEKILHYLHKHILKYIQGYSREKALEIFLFIFRESYPYSIKDYAAVEAAKTDISKGYHLPYEVLIGIRNQYHKDVDIKKVLEHTKDKLTDYQKLALQRKSKEVDVTIQVDFSKQDLVRLVKYAYEMGLNDELRETLKEKAEKIAGNLRMKLGNIAIIIDNSLSMAGSKNQKNDPIARSLAMAKVFQQASNRCTTLFTSDPPDAELPEPSGSTSIGEVIVKAVRSEPDMILLFSDGYENRPEGLTDLVLTGLEKIGIRIPVLHFNPCYAVESSQVKQLSQKTLTLPLSDANHLQGTFIRLMIEKKEKQGLNYLKQYLMLAGRRWWALPGMEQDIKQLEKNLTIDVKEMVQ